MGFGCFVFFHVDIFFLFSGTSSHKFTQHIHTHTHTHKLPQVQRLNPPLHAGRRILRRAEKRWPPGGRGRDTPSNQAPDACIIPWRGRAGRGRGGVLVFSRPQWVCWGRGRSKRRRVGLQDWLITVERDAISPGRAPGTSQSTQRAALSETRRPQVKPPPKRQTPADWRLRSPGGVTKTARQSQYITWADIIIIIIIIWLVP